MPRILMAILALSIFLLSDLSTLAQQSYRLPDIRSLKHLTTRKSDRAPDIPGKETNMDFYSAPSGQIITIYSFQGRDVAFTTHFNKDMQGTYRLFMDMNGDGLFQEVNRGTVWQIPAWARR
ncbi:MAG: hypothetical protein RDU20_22880 [Desulfomonilaceae bacterium]|nr:hypothetical protein [Desulfomonilaceae bacterium]